MAGFWKEHADRLAKRKKASERCSEAFSVQLAEERGDLANALSEHGVRDLLKAADVRTHDKVVLVAVLFSGLNAGLENVDHNIVQTLINPHKPAAPKKQEPER